MYLLPAPAAEPAPSEMSATVDKTIPAASTNPVVVYLASLAPRSQRTMRQSLALLAELASRSRMDPEAFPWASVRPEHVAAWKAKLNDSCKFTTANKHLAALRGVLKATWRVGAMDSETYARTIDFQPIRGSTLPNGRSLDAGELRSLFVACSKDPRASGRRDAAALAILYGAGLRRSEAAALDLDDVNAETGELRIRTGKGNKGRLSYLSNGGLQALKDWLVARGPEPGPLLCPVNQRGVIIQRRMTDQSIYALLKKRGAQAGLASFSPHDMRRTFVGDLLEAGADISQVQQLAGHSNVTTTQRYDRRPEQTKRKASALLHVPYTKAV